LLTSGSGIEALQIFYSIEAASNMIFDRSTVRRLSCNGRLPLTPSSKNEAVASFLVVDGKGVNETKSQAEKSTPVKVLLTKSPPSRASTSSTLNETQSITPLSEYSPNHGDSVLGNCGPVENSKNGEQETGYGAKESPVVHSQRTDCTFGSKETHARSRKNDIAQDRISDTFPRIETGNRATEANTSNNGVTLNSNEGEISFTKQLMDGSYCGNMHENIAARDDFALIKVCYNGYVRLIPINSRTDDIGSATKELAVLLRAAFGISQQQYEVVGLVESTGNSEPQIVVPLSTVVSGRFIRESGEFELLVSVGDREVDPSMPSQSSYQQFLSDDVSSSHETFDEEAIVDTTEGGFISADLYFHIIRQFVKENELEAYQGESLSSYISEKFVKEDGEITGALQAAYQVFMFSRQIDRFVCALKSIADCIMREQFSDGEYDEEEAVLQLSSIEHLLDTAQFLYSSNDLSVAAYIALCQNIIESDAVVTSVYQSYRMCLEQDFDEDATASLEGLEGTPSSHSLDYLLHAMRQVGEDLEPIGVDSDLKGHPVLLTWAFNLGAYDLPQQAREFLFKRFIGGDEFIQSACQLFLLDQDIDSLVEALLTRFKILQQDKWDGLLDDLPDTVVAAVTHLVEHGCINMADAAALTSSFAIGDSSLELCHEKFMINGDAQEFLLSLENHVKKVTALDKLQEPSLDSDFAALDNNKENIPDCPAREDNQSYDVIFDVLKDFDPAEVAALRLSAARRDPLFRCALEQFRDDGNTNTLCHALHQVAETVVEDTVEKIPGYDDAKEQINNERRYGLRLILAYLVENGIMKTAHGCSLLERFDDGDSAVHDALRSFEATYDASSFVVRLRSI